MSKKAVYVPRRGDVIYINLDPSIGHEQGGRRTALVLSPVDYNRVTGLGVFAPITNSVKGYPFEVAIPQNEYVSGVVLADHVKNLDWRGRHAAFVCSLDEEVVADTLEKLIALLDPKEEE